MESPTPRKAKPRTYSYLDLEFLLQEAPGLLGERSNMGGFLSALSSGGPGHSVASSDEHHDHQIDRLEWVGKARRLLRVWQCLDRHTQVVLTAYYTPRVRWPQGYEQAIGPELASVSLAFPPDGDGRQLSEVCQRIQQPKPKVTKANKEALLALWSGYRAYIQRAKDEASDHVALAHEEWDRIRRIVEPKNEEKDERTRELDEFEAKLGEAA